MHPLIVSLEQIQYQRYETLHKTNNKEKLKCWGSHNTYWYKWSKQRLYTKRDCNQSYGSCCWCKEKSSQEVANYNKALNVNRELTELCASIIYIKHGNIHPWNHLTLSWRRQLSYRNQSIDLRSKSMDWFLYDSGLRHERFNIWPYKLQTFQLIHSTFILITILGRSPQEVFLKIVVLERFTKFGGKHLYGNSF